MKKYKNKGFTLVELMVAIVLGLLIVAAATQLFITGQVSLNLQKAMADIQDNSNFGISYISSDLRKANYNAEKPLVTSTTKFGGIVIADTNFPSDLTSRPAATLLTSNASQSATGKLTDTASDQLTIQYYVAEDTIDCEGNNVVANSMIVQRYFIDGSDLKCDAGFYPFTKPTAKGTDGVVLPYVLNGLNANAQTIIKNVEYMRILLAVSDDNAAAGTGTGNQSALPVDTIAQKNLRYISINNYPATGTLPRIRGIQLGLLMKANDSVSSSKELEDKNKATFRVLDQDVSLVTKDKKFLHQVVTQTIALRNALGASS